MKVKVYYCEKCDNVKFPNSSKVFQICRCCHKEPLNVVEIEVEKVTA